ncbi:hypothetical protein CYMTET_23601 [Cymbomonas tetramitiformis]|uniref:Uncharacterized protein n=1 Tax=Cymbomonas tetramitiformis TaxID=36881 RepID=A0AAE0FXH4_9CHLO|nr:hypothetical protein CYMTET_23601 [Cymbomonas tetramitiformis]
MSKFQIAVLCLCLVSAEAGFLSKLSLLGNAFKEASLGNVVKKVTTAQTHDEFSAFKAKYAKEYASAEEHLRRQLIFTANLEIIAELNSEQAPHATFAVTKYADLTQAEFKEVMRCRKANSSEVMPAAEAYYPDLEAAPASVDWVAKGAVTPVKDQGQCGSCWAFGTTGVVEGAWFLAGNPLVSLSEEELVQCEKGDDGCDGGLQATALKWILKEGGLVSEKDYPYTSGSGTTGSCNKKKEKKAVAASIKSWKNVMPHTAAALKSAVAKQPVTIAVNAGTSVFQFYDSGIMKGNKRTCDPTDLDHAVLNVGYGTSNGMDFWKVKNSWNTDWGEDGYFRIERGSNTCGCESDAQIATA